MTFQEKGGYLPGSRGFYGYRAAMVGTRTAESPIWQQVDHGVTVSACGGPAYGGGTPHHQRHLYGYPDFIPLFVPRAVILGKCFLLSTIYVNWSTSLLGDPLYHPDLHRYNCRWSSLRKSTLSEDRDPFSCGRRRVGIVVLWTLKSDHSAEKPEVALLVVEVCEEDGWSAVMQPAGVLFFSARPSCHSQKFETGYRHTPIAPY